jgi:hypothetical protein
MSVLPDFFRGDTYPLIRIEYTGIDITGWIFTLTMKTSLDDETPALQVQVTATGVDATEGKASIVITSEMTSSLTPKTYVMDIERRIPGSPDNVKTIVFQKIKCMQDVTT